MTSQTSAVNHRTKEEKSGPKMTKRDGSFVPMPIMRKHFSHILIYLGKQVGTADDGVVKCLTRSIRPRRALPQLQDEYPTLGLDYFTEGKLAGVSWIVEQLLRDYHAERNKTSKQVGPKGTHIGWLTIIVPHFPVREKQKKAPSSSNMSLEADATAMERVEKQYGLQSLRAFREATAAPAASASVARGSQKGKRRSKARLASNDSDEGSDESDESESDERDGTDERDEGEDGEDSDELTAKAKATKGKEQAKPACKKPAMAMAKEPMAVALEAVADDLLGLLDYLKQNAG